MRAARHNRLAEAEHREILRQALAGEPAEAPVEVAARLRELTRGRKHTPSQQLQREPGRAVSGFVVDARLANKWFVDEPGSAQAAVLLRQPLVTADMRLVRAVCISRCAELVVPLSELGAG